MSENRKNRIEKNFGKSTTDGKVYEYSASLERFMTENGLNRRKSKRISFKY